MATAGTFTYTDFSDVSALQLNGVSAQAGNILRVVADVDPLATPFGNAGSAYYNTGFSFDAYTAFRSMFGFNIAQSVIHPGDGPLDGFTFVL